MTLNLACALQICSIYGTMSEATQQALMLDRQTVQPAHKPIIPTTFF